MELISGPHWHEHNPWRDNLIYVSLEELAACHHAVNDPSSAWRMVDAIAHWLQYGDQLDAYILVNTTLMSAGVRYGPEPHQYLSPAFSLPKLWALREHYRHPRTSEGGMIA